MNKSEIERNIVIALEKIKAVFDTPEGEESTTLFVSHHLNEIEPAQWQAAVGNKNPNPDQILASLIPIDQWSSNDDEIIDTFDFSLPNDLTNYLLTVRVVDGTASDVAMES